MGSKKDGAGAGTSRSRHYYSKDQDSVLRLRKISAEFFGRQLSFSTASGVFSFGRVDSGTRILIQNCVMKGGWHVLDLGCGNGIVGLCVAAGFPDSKVVMSDINLRAVNTARMNIKENGVMNAQAVHGDMFVPVKGELFDTILLNPPQSAGKDVCAGMIIGSKSFLKDGGLLQVVARHNKGGGSLSSVMKETFGNLDVLAKKSGYWVYASRKDIQTAL